MERKYIVYRTGKGCLVGFSAAIVTFVLVLRFATNPEIPMYLGFEIVLFVLGVFWIVSFKIDKH